MRAAHRGQIPRGAENCADEFAQGAAIDSPHRASSTTARRQRNVLRFLIGRTRERKMPHAQACWHFLSNSTAALRAVHSKARSHCAITTLCGSGWQPGIQHQGGSPSLSGQIGRCRMFTGGYCQWGKVTLALPGTQHAKPSLVVHVKTTIHLPAAARNTRLPSTQVEL